MNQRQQQRNGSEKSQLPRIWYFLPFGLEFRTINRMTFDAKQEENHSNQQPKCNRSMWRNIQETFSLNNNNNELIIVFIHIKLAFATMIWPATDRYDQQLCFW